MTLCLLALGDLLGALRLDAGVVVANRGLGRTLGDEPGWRGREQLFDLGRGQRTVEPTAGETGDRHSELGGNHRTRVRTGAAKLGEPLRRVVLQFEEFGARYRLALEVLGGSWQVHPELLRGRLRLHRLGCHVTHTARVPARRRYPETVPVPFVVAYVLGVTPNKWVGVWKERMPEHPIELRQLSESDARAALADGTADAAFLRFTDEPTADDTHSVIALYTEQPVVVAPKDHALTAFDTVTMADLAAENLLEGQDAAAVELVGTGVGIAIMPQSVARAHSRRDVTARLITDAPTTKIALVWPIDRTTDAVDEWVGIVRGRTANSSRSAVVDEPKEPVAPKKQQPQKKAAVRRPGQRPPRKNGNTGRSKRRN